MSEKEFSAGDKVVHSVYGPAIVVGRHKAIYSNAPDETIIIKPYKFPDDGKDYAENQMVDENSCTAF